MHDGTTSPSTTPTAPEGRTMVIGGGPAGLTAGYLLAKRDADVVVYEAADQVGGIAMTVVRDGYGCLSRSWNVRCIAVSLRQHEWLRPCAHAIDIRSCT